MSEEFNYGRKNTRRSLKRLSFQEKQDIITLYEKKETNRQIAKKLDISLKVIKKFIREFENGKVELVPDMKIKGIYLIQNDITGQKYIGQSVDILARWSSHSRGFNKKSYAKLYEAMNKYGLAAFSWKILIHDPNLTRVQLKKLENTFIKYYDATNPDKGYNTLYNTKEGFYPEEIIKGKTETEILQAVFSDKQKLFPGSI